MSPKKEKKNLQVYKTSNSGSKIELDKTCLKLLKNSQHSYWDIIVCINILN